MFLIINKDFSCAKIADVQHNNYYNYSYNTTTKSNIRNILIQFYKLLIKSIKFMRIFYLLVAFTLSSFFSHAQGTTGYSGTGSNIDVYNYQIWWRLNPDSAVGIKGVVTIKFKTVVNNVTTVSFDLRDVLVIDNIKYHGANVTPTRVAGSKVFSVPVNVPLSGSRDSITVIYHGAPPVAAIAEGGFNLASDANAGNFINTLSESYEDRDWWPCKADMQDKADTVDITVNVPYRTNAANAANATDTFWVASNGTLIDSSFDISGAQAGRNRTFKYINRYPIASYLVSVAVARFTRYYQAPVPIGGYNVPVVYYLLAGKTAALYTTIVTAMDKATELLTKFSEKYGDYGFIDPAKGGKHGFYEGLSGAEGMEHQTFSAISTSSISDKNVLIHELQHQWFGDKVSFATWQDLWLAEGFAEYAPALAKELVTGLGSTAYSFRNSLRTNAIAEKAPVQIPPAGIANSNLIWSSGTCATCYGTSVYQRGAMVVSMLRTLAGDTKFFNIMKEYQTRPSLEFKSATTGVLAQIFTDSLGLDVTEFFTDNVIGTGYPTNTVGYTISGPTSKRIALNTKTQTRTNAGSSTYISQPIVVHLQNKTGSTVNNDTTIVFYDWGGNLYSKAGRGVLGPKTTGGVAYNLSFTPNTFIYDDSARTTSAGSVIASSVVVALNVIDFTAKPHAGYNEAVLLLDNNATGNSVVLERSDNGINFTEIGTMQLWAGSASPKKYVFNDMSPLKADNYYRAKYKDDDGSYIYSKVVRIGGAKAESFTLVSNPVGDALEIRASSEALNKKVSVSVFDASSKMLFTKQYSNIALITEIPVGKLARGVYFIRIAGESGDTQNIKFIKQ
jgi:aminopeptidase N